MKDGQHDGYGGITAEEEKINERKQVGLTQINKGSDSGEETDVADTGEERRTDRWTGRTDKHTVQTGQ